MAEEATAVRYEPDPEFEEVKEEAMLDLSPTGTKEFWLIQWVKDKDLDVSDFHDRDIYLDVNNDGNLGSLESSSGKSFELVSFAYQQPNATVFLPSGSETKPVAKITRRVCLVRLRHREREELGTSAAAIAAAATAQTSAAKQTPEREELGTCAAAIAAAATAQTSAAKQTQEREELGTCAAAIAAAATAQTTTQTLGRLCSGILTLSEAQLHPKNQLKIYASRRGIQQPVYCSLQEGTCLFKSKVVIDGLEFESPEGYPTKKAAKVAAAKLALASLPQEAISQVKSVSAEAQLHPKDQLQIYAIRRGIQLPVYCSLQEGTCLFKAKVVIDGLEFESPEGYPTKKAAEVAAAKFALASVPQEAISQVKSVSAGSARRAPKSKKYLKYLRVKKKEGSLLHEQTPEHNKKREE